MSTPVDHALPEHLRPPPRRSRRWIWTGGGLFALAVVAVLAFGVFGVQNLWIDDEVAEAAPVFSSGASLPSTSAGGAAPPTSAAPPGEGSSTTTAPAVTVAATGTFVERGHPGTGTVNLLTDGTQTFVRFEDDFATDNGPDLRAIAIVDGVRVDLGALKGNIGAQNYELPADVDPSAVESVEVWCRRFDYVFTDAALAPAD